MKQLKSSKHAQITRKKPATCVCAVLFSSVHTFLFALLGSELTERANQARVCISCTIFGPNFLFTSLQKISVLLTSILNPLEALLTRGWNQEMNCVLTRNQGTICAKSSSNPLRVDLPSDLTSCCCSQKQVSRGVLKSSSVV